MTFFFSFSSLLCLFASTFLLHFFFTSSSFDFQNPQQTLMIFFFTFHSLAVTT
ncbi:hypothetical protein Lalb_Chr23g0273181 [Lupinus albus]|uniref:Uncharacterized protein n=1 Tax=Lupinus albus TaxID=3870 RepID=A0A6A4N910_LUPAL|nr:hypothetical protein Lalb_Chr23g0273181 [Lupinus albus]